MDYDFEGTEEFDIEEALNKCREKAVAGFVDACYEALQTIIDSDGLIEEEGEQERGEILKAMRRMLALFEILEDYEACQITSLVMENEFFEENRTPDYGYIQELDIA
jgi:hypothetical protein